MDSLRNSTESGMSILSSNATKEDDTLSSLYFKSLKDLETWYRNYDEMVKRKKFDKFRIPSEVLSGYSNSLSHTTSTYDSGTGLGEHGPNVMVCHDYKGNFLNDEDLNPQGYFPHFSGHRYHLQFPHLIHQFIYFSHYRISIPPPCWVNFCHKNNISIYGCLIVEGDSGGPVLDELIKRNELGEFKYVAMLVLLAKHYRFEGFLLNFEASFNSPNVKFKNQELLNFTECLKSALHCSIPGSKLIWYDALIPTINKVKYINGVSKDNDYLLEKCDWFFTNYWWDEKNLQQNLKLIGLSGVSRKLFVGCDVWGRGTRVGNGGFEVSLAVEYIKRYSSNAAIFAPAWTLEYFGQKSFSKSDSAFWIGNRQQTQCIASSVPEKPASLIVSETKDNLTGFKFYTDFNKGEGTFFNMCGIRQYNRNWVNTNLQNNIPIITYKEQNNSSLVISLDFEESYYGSNSLSIKQYDNNDEDFNEPKILFNFNGKCLQPYILICMHYKYMKPNLDLEGEFGLGINYVIEKRKKNSSKLVHQTFKVRIPNNSSNWQNIETTFSTPDLSPGDTCIIKSISIFFKYIQSGDWLLVSNGSESGKKLLYELIIGDLALQSSENIFENTTSLTLSVDEVKNFEIHDKTGTSYQILEWEDDPQISYWVIYVNGNFVGTSHLSRYCLSTTIIKSSETLVRVDCVTKIGQQIRGSLLKIKT